jgi:6-phosphogluconolactonase (cycloisomerase 2 family)
MDFNRPWYPSVALMIVVCLSGFTELGCSNSNTMKTPNPVAQELLYLPNGDSTTSAYVINSDGSLTAVVGSPFSVGGFGAGTDSGGKFLFTAGRTGLTTFTVASSGAPTAASSVNDSTLAGNISINPAGTALYAVSIDVAQGNHGWKTYSIQADGTLQFVSGQIDQVNGPLVFASGGSNAYSATCYHLSANIEHFTVVSSGALNSTGEQIALISTNPSECPEAVAIDPAGDTTASAWSDADSSGPVDNAIALYAIDPNTHALTLTSASPFSASGKGRDINYDPSGKFIVVAQDDGIGVYQAGQNSVSEISGSPFASGTDFNRLLFSPTGTFVVAISQTSQQVRVFTFNTSTGVLTTAPGSPLSATAGYNLAILQQ